MKTILKIVTFLFVLSLFCIREETLLFFYISSALFFIASSFSYFLHIREKEDFIIFRKYLLFVFICGLSLFWAIDLILAFKMFIRVLVISLIIYLLINNNRRVNLINVYVFALISGVFLNFILFVSPLKTILANYPNRFTGTFSNANELAITCIFSIYFIFKFSSYNNNFPKIAIPFFLIMCEVLILATESRKGLILGNLMMFIGTWDYLRKNFSKKIFIVLCFFMIVLSLILPYLIDYFVNQNSFNRFSGFIEFTKNTEDGDSSTRWRFFFIEKGIEIFLNNPLFGVGIDNFQTFTGKGLYAHNNFIELLADLGIIGFLIYYNIYHYLFIYIYRIKSQYIDFALLVILLLMEIALVSYYYRLFWISLVFFYLINKDCAKKKLNNRNIFLKKYLYED